MSRSTAMKLDEELLDAMRPTYGRGPKSQAEVRQDVENDIRHLDLIVSGGAFSAFDLTVGEHRESLQVVDAVLGMLAHFGSGMIRRSTQFPELQRRMDRLMPQAVERLRVVRALKCILISDTPAIDDPEAERKARALFQQHASRVLSRLSEEERRELAVAPNESAELKVWLAS